MAYPHAIRLRGPWQLEPICRYVAMADKTAVESQDHLPPPCKVKVPSDWGEPLGRDFRGRVRYRRSFQSPTALDPHERVWLVVDGLDARGTVAINGHALGDIDGYACRGSFEVTKLLSARNEVVIDVELPLGTSGGPLRPGRELLPGGLIREVRLEIRSAWFIDELAVWSTGIGSQFVAAGRVCGDVSPSGFAVVFSGCQRELAYLELPRRDSFEIPFEADDFPKWTADRPALSPIEVKLLVGGSSVWQTQLDTAVRQSSGYTGGQILDEIPADGDYAELDRLGLPHVQRVPLEWSYDVCRRLAHHPSILAWSNLPQDELEPAPAVGREWVWPVRAK